MLLDNRLPRSTKYLILKLGMQPTLLGVRACRNYIKKKLIILKKLPDGMTETVLLGFSEAATNIVKHSPLMPEEIIVSVRKMPDMLTLRIEDNGSAINDFDLLLMQSIYRYEGTELPESGHGFYIMAMDAINITYVPKNRAEDFNVLEISYGL